MALAENRETLDAASIAIGMGGRLDGALDDEQMRLARPIVASLRGYEIVTRSPDRQRAQAEARPCDEGQHSKVIKYTRGWTR